MLAVRDDDDLDAVETRMGEDVLDGVAMRPAQEQPARVAPIMAEFLAAFADGRRVDERKQLLEVPRQECVAERLVRVLQGPQEEIALEIGLEFAQTLQAAGDLLVQGADMGRQETMQRKGVPLLLGERRPLVQQRIGEERRALKLSLDCRRPCPFRSSCFETGYTLRPPLCTHHRKFWVIAAATRAGAAPRPNWASAH
jgi:hypothetical protein